MRSGYGGITAGIDLLNRYCGTAFRVVLVIDSNAASLKAHSDAYPSIPTKLWDFSSQTATIDTIATLYPMDRWAMSVWFASVEPDPDESIEVRSLAKRSHWMIRMLRRANPLLWILEQLPSTAPYLVAHADNLTSIQYRDYDNIDVLRRRIIASSHPLKLEKYEGPRSSPMSALGLNTDEYGSRIPIVTNGFNNHIRPANLPLQEFGTDGLRVGIHVGETKSLTPAQLASALGIDDQFKPDGHRRVWINGAIR